MSGPQRRRGSRILLARVCCAGLALFALASPAAGDWTASGRFNYTDRLYDLAGFTGTAPAPVREADVEVYDLNSLAVLASGATDASGDFSLFVVDAATRDVGVRVLASTGQTASLDFSVVDDASGDAVYLYHDVATDQSGHGSSSDVAFGTMTMPAAIGTVATTDWSSQVFNTFDMALLAADWIASVDGARPSVGYVIGWNPTNGRGGSFYNGGSNRLSLSDDDAYDDPNILHEVGHYIEDEFGSSQNTGGSHSIGDDDQDPRLSWSEGLATFFSNASIELSGRPRPDIYCDRDSFGVSGGGGFAYQLESAVSGGSTNEQAVNAALWDIIDTSATLDGSPGSDDDPTSNAHSDVWAVVEEMRVTAPPNTQLEDFWELWFALGQGTQADLETSFAAHQIDFATDAQEPNDSPAAASALTVGASYQENSFYRSGAEPRGDEDWFRFSATTGSYYRVEVSGSANTIYGRPDPELFLLSPDLVPLAFSDDPYDTSLNDQAVSSAQDMDETAPAVLFQAATTGDHYAYLRHASHPLNLDGRYGTYQVRVQSVASPTPSITSVAAQRMLVGESYQALVVGSDFALGATVTLGDPGLSTSQVHWISPTALVATIDVGAGVADGSYSLTISNPGAGSDVANAAIEVNSASVPPVVITEVELGADRVEVRNLGTAPAVLSNWEIRSYRPGSAINTFTFPTFTLAAGATVVVSEAGGTDTATELFDPAGLFNWPWLNEVGGAVSLVDDGGRNVDFIRFVDSFVDEHEAPLGSGGLWMQPELFSPALGLTLSRAEPSALYRSSFGLSAAEPTMPAGASGRDNATDPWEDNDAPRRARLFATGATIDSLAISPRPSGSDDDWFGFAIDAGEAIDFAAVFSHATGNLEMDLYPPGEELVPILSATSSDDDETLSLTGALTTANGSGVYRVRVFGNAGAVNSYSLTATVVGGVCGDNIVDPGETCDDGNTLPGDCCSAICQIEPLGTSCRAATDVCDVAEVCDGVSDQCPVDGFEPPTTECRASTGSCDAADFCDGLGAACGADLKLTSECRAVADVCDVAEVCDGVANDCPTDGFEPATTECRASTGACDAADFCDGLGTACGADLKLTSECRAVADVCDVAEVCDGVANDCPTDGFEPATTECRASTGACDAADFCDGLGTACGADLKLTSECRAVADVCDVAEVCDGVANDCPTDGFEPPTTECRASTGACDAADFCDGLGTACGADLKLTSECRAVADVCDVAEVCDGVANDCPTDGFEPPTTECRASIGFCDAADFCDGLGAACGADLKLTSECRAVADVCDVAEVCDGVANDCPTDGFEPPTTECRASIGFCDAAELCTGLAASCPADQVFNGLPCPDGDVCNGDEICDVAAACIPGMSLDCDDQDICTADGCDAITGCFNTPIPGCTPSVPGPGSPLRFLLGLALLLLGTLVLAQRASDEAS